MASTPGCIQTYYGPIDVATYTIPVGTILYSGARDTFPTSKINSRLQNLAPDSTHLYKYFTPNFKVASSFAKLSVTNTNTKGYIAKYRVIKPIHIVLNYLTKNKYSEHFYFDRKNEYASPEAQCLCSEGFHGYASMTDGGLEDIGLCTELDTYLELVGYTTTKSGFTNSISFGGYRQSTRKRRVRRSLRRSRRRV